MGKQDALYLLIKSLGTGDKALVRQLDKGKAGYLALFDLIARGRGYDERKVKRKLQQQGHDLNFAYAKNYLAKHILKTLREARDLPGSQVQKQIQEIEILRERKIFAMADKLLGKTLQKSWEEERFEAFLQVSGYEIERILREGERVAENIAEIDALNAQRRRARAALSELGELEDLFFTYQPISKRKRSARNEIDMEVIGRFRAHPLLQPGQSQLSARARRLYLKSLTHIHAYAGELEASLARRREVIAHFEAHPFLLQDHPVDYLNELLALGSLQLHFEEHAACRATMAQMKAFQEAHSLHGSEMFDKYYRLLLAYAIESGDHAAVQSQLPDIEEGLALHADSLAWTSLSMLYFFLARLHFEVGDFSAARRWTGLILGHTTRGIREDITSIARILEIFTHFEEGDFDLVEAQSRATRKYLARREQLHLFEARILKFLERHSFHSGAPGENEALRELHGDLGAIFENPLERPVLSYFDILAWLEGKLEG